MDVELIAGLADATYSAHAPHQLVDLAGEHVSAQCDPAIIYLHVDGTGMRDHPADCGPDPLLQYLVVRLILPKTGAYLGRGPDSPVAGISSRRRNPVSELLAGVYNLIA
jgi:hypothetical protein